MTATDYRSTQGNFQRGITQGFTNGDGQIDGILFDGYNTNGGGRINTNEAGFSTNLENHFLAGGNFGQFEWYTQIFSRNGSITRPIAINSDKQNGGSTFLFNGDTYTFFTNPTSGTLNNMSINLPVGSLTLQGTAPQITFTNTTPITGGQIIIAPQSGGGTTLTNSRGNLTFTNTGQITSFSATSIGMTLTTTNGLNITNSTTTGTPSGVQVLMSTAASAYAYYGEGTQSGNLEIAAFNAHASGGVLFVGSTSGGNIANYFTTGGGLMVSGVKGSDGSFHVGKTLGWGSNDFFSISQTGALTFGGIPRFNGTNTTGAGSALLGTNSPAVTNTAYIPAWK